MAKSVYLVKPVYKALHVLECLGQEKRELSLSQICRRVNLPKTTTYRYLHTLCASGLVAHNPETDSYRLGLHLWELGQLVEAQLHIRQVALPFMQQMRDRFNETVNLGILDGTEIVYVEMVQSKLALRMHATLGGRDPAYSTAMGKAILSHLPGEQWREHLPPRLSKRTAKKLTSIATLKVELRATRKRGFARDDGENEVGARCIGVPILNQRGAVVAALSVSAPAARLNDKLEPAVVSAVIETAHAIAQRLGNHVGK